VEDASRKGEQVMRMPRTLVAASCSLAMFAMTAAASCSLAMFAMAAAASCSLAMFAMAVAASCSLAMFAMAAVGESHFSIRKALDCSPIFECSSTVD
jgi:hypothetical protein